MITLAPYNGVIPDKTTQTKEEFVNAVHPFIKWWSVDCVPQFNDFANV